MEKEMTNNESSKAEMPKSMKTPLEVTNTVSRDVDLGEALEISATFEEERKVLRKIDWIMIPLMGFCYMLQYMDKLAISQATLLGLRQDLVRDDTRCDI
ncbi:hypothetical protein Plec18167_002881 [Paecilomyces lecythidis]|uniref:Uncharacterized protein n=1 Tax=Paecilomyces lecythidis TaxID=3004212 RepID=A0ABR3Y3E8_9EURO